MSTTKELTKEEDEDYEKSSSESSSEKKESQKDDESEKVFITEKIKRIFRLFDMDKDELINMEEMRTIFQQMGQEPTEDELIDMLVEVDEDQNGTIEIDEFKKLIEKMMEDSDDLVMEAFKVFDKDQDGHISPNEFREVMAKLGENITDDEMT